MVRCINPPFPPATTHLVYDHINGTEVEFGDNVTYTCEAGYHLDSGYGEFQFNIQCDNGSWSDHLPWKICIDPTGNLVIWFECGL